MKERKPHKRYPAGGVQGTIRIPSDGRDIPVEFIDFSRGGAAVKLAPDCTVPAETKLKLMVDNIEVGGRTIARMSDNQGFIQLKIRFDYSDRENIKSVTLLENALGSRVTVPMASQPEEETTIVDDGRIGQILASYLFYRKGRIYVSDGRLKPLGSGAATNDGRHIVILFDEPHDCCEGQVLHFTFNGYICFYAFKERVVEVGSRTLTVARPLVLTRKRSRKLPRFRSADLDVYVLSPRDGKTFLSGKVEDVGFGGIAAAIEKWPEELGQGTRIEKIIVQMPGCGEVQFAGVVKYAGSAPGGELSKSGIAITSFFRGCEKVWNRYVYSLMFPDLSNEGFDFKATELYALLADSRYLSLCGRKTKFYEPTAPSFADFFELSRNAQNERNCLFHVGDRLMGIASKNRLYSNIYLLHHLGIDKENGLQLFNKDLIARQVYLGLFVDAFLTEDLEYCVFYFSAKKKWNKYMYEDFLDGLSDRSQYIYCSYNFLEFDLSAWDRAGAPFGHDQDRVKTAQGRLLVAVSDFLRKNVPPLMFEAYDYAADRIDLMVYNRAAEGGMSRERRIFYCQRFGEITGMALVESSSHTVNLFNICDSVRVFVSADLPEDEKQEIKSALLKKAVFYFASLCKSYFMYFCYDRDFSYAERLGFRKIDDSMELIITKQLIPSYIDFVELVLSGIANKRGIQR